VEADAAAGRHAELVPDGAALRLAEALASLASGLD
jgi:hypothetical protein